MCRVGFAGASSPLYFDRIFPPSSTFFYTMAEKKKSECTLTYCDIMKNKHWRAALFDWQFGGRDESERPALIQERQCFNKMVKKLNFEVYGSVKETRSLSKTNFLKELKRFKELCVSEPCGCIFLTISAHGTFVKADDQRDGGDLEFVEDCISIPNNELVPIQEIIEVFRDETLNKIPKIFFIQACRGKELDIGHPLDGNKNVGQDQNDDEPNRAHSTPYLENSVIVYSTPFGYSAGSSNKKGSHVWEVLKNTLDEILKQGDEKGPVKLLSWLKETNGVLAKSEMDINDGSKEIRYKPLLSICHTLTREILFAIDKVDKDPV